MRLQATVGVRFVAEETRWCSPTAPEPRRYAYSIKVEVP